MSSERPVATARPASFAAALALVALAALLVACVYGRSLRYPLTRDDPAHLGQVERFARPPAQWGDHFREEFWAQGSRSGLYRPLTALTIQATVHVAGREPPALRIGNLALLALAAAAAGLLARRMGVGGGAAALLTALVAVHPLLSETALEVVSRSETQAALGVLAAAGLLARGGGGGAVALLVLASFGAALLSKEGAFAALPALLYLLFASRAEPAGDGSGRATERARAPGRGLPLLALAVALLAALALRVAVFGDFVGFAPEETAYVDNPLIDADFGTRLATGLHVLGRYLALLAWPRGLSIDWSYAEIAPSAALDRFALGGAAALLLGLFWLIAALRGGAARRAEAFGLLLAGGSWLLISNVARPVGTVMGERLFTLPAIGLLLASVAALARTAGRPPLRGLLAVVAAAAVAALGWRGTQRTAEWRDGLVLYESAARVAPQSARVHCTLAHLLRARGRDDEAQAAAERALELLPEYGKAHAELGGCLAARGATGAALVHLWLSAAAPQSGMAEQLALQTAERRFLGDARVRADFVRRAEQLEAKWGTRPLFAALAKERLRVSAIR
ncbi:MAG: DUF1736 domain-containing protein [Planctomycetes bacterium]|nr:DUF1736 domain-containing protein [Planctomycetota bacterium]